MCGPNIGKDEDSQNDNVVVVKPYEIVHKKVLLAGKIFLESHLLVKVLLDKQSRSNNRDMAIILPAFQLCYTYQGSQGFLES